MKIDSGAQVPLYEQVAAELRRVIADGEVRPGQRMPLAKDLAAVLGVNKNTVLRALRQLRDEGLLEFRRGRGITVAGTPPRGAVMSKVRELVAFGREQGYRPEELIAMIKDISPGFRCSFSLKDPPSTGPSAPRRTASAPGNPRR